MSVNICTYIVLSCHMSSTTSAPSLTRTPSIKTLLTNTNLSQVMPGREQNTTHRVDTKIEDEYSTQDGFNSHITISKRASRHSIQEENAFLFLIAPDLCHIAHGILVKI